jgi:hypothetical protein
MRKKEQKSTCSGKVDAVMCKLLDRVKTLEVKLSATSVVLRGIVKAARSIVGK